MTDLLTNEEILLPQDEAVHMANVLCCSIDTGGNISGTVDEDMNLNTLTYNVEFLNGAVKEYTENVIAENIVMQVDSNGYNSSRR